MVILGIKYNGMSMQIDTLEFDSDQTYYDYNCNVTLRSSNNGNGMYDISILNKNFVQGFPIGKWRITKACLSYDWGNSYAYFIMTDEVGKETKKITASKQKGFVSGFDVDLLTRSIFSKAQKIVSEYPSSNIYNVISDLQEEKERYYWKGTMEWFYKDYPDMNEFIEDVQSSIDKLSCYLAKYQDAKNILEECKDERAERLLTQINNDCISHLQSLKCRT